ncbi:MAG: Fic family protein [Patescibacteria group bacterium]|nr:Fic family protein [Patescibacteria group bacterium]
MFKPKYNLNNKIVSLLTAIAQAKTAIEKARLLPTQELQLRRQALVKMSQSSTAIEGNQLNVNQVEALLLGKKVDAPQRDIYEVKNYLKTLKYIEKIVNENLQLTGKVILRMHRLVTDKTLPKEQSGYYRKGKVFVVKRSMFSPDEVIYTAPEAKLVPELMEDLVEWLFAANKENIHPIIQAGISHRQLASIHPFSDGNGRTARALATLILYKNGYDFRRFFALEDYYNIDRQKYYKAVHIGPKYRPADFTKWLEYFVEGFKESILRVQEQIDALSVAKISKKLANQIYLNKKQLQIIDFINAVGKITVSDAVDILHCARRTAQLELQKLKKLKITKQVGKGPSAFYVVIK